MIDLASNLDIVQKSGAWYAYKGEKIGQGRENAKLYLADHPEIFDEIAHMVRIKSGLEAKEAPEDAAASGVKGTDAGDGSKEDNGPQE